MKTIPSLADLLEIDERDRRGLEWTRNRARFWMTAVKRRWQLLSPCETLSPEEAATFRALVVMEEAAGQLLRLGYPTACTDGRSVLG